MFNNIEMDDMLDEVLYLQNDVSAIRRVENNRRRNERNRLRRDEINNLQNERNRLNRDKVNRHQNERNRLDRDNVNRRHNERNRLDRDNVNRRQNERNRLARDKVNRRQNERRAVGQGRMYSIARSNAIPDYNYLGEMNQVCQHCSAKKFLEEAHFLCCHNGKVVFPPLSPFDQALQDLFKGSYVDHNANVNFLKHIRNYNAFLSFASFTANVVQPMNHGPPCFKICGQIFHRVGNLRPDQDIPPIYSQLYIYDPLAAVNFRMQQRGNDLCLRDLMFQLQTIITEQSPFAFLNQVSS